VATSDGISGEDWDKVHEFAVEIVNADDVESEMHRSQLLSYLDQLEKKYGELPSILATRADYIKELESKEELLTRAYMLASTFQDAGNQLYVAHSLAELYIEDFQDPTKGKVWLEHFGKQLEQTKDMGYLEDYQRLRTSIEGIRGETEN
jgi:mannose/cellobiose epimerase-like protein (N-acyl-D-glucosamine 2-epimerase family)